MPGTDERTSRGQHGRHIVYASVFFLFVKYFSPPNNEQRGPEGQGALDLAASATILYTLS
jgi:hypothetical protein